MMALSLWPTLVHSMDVIMASFDGSLDGVTDMSLFNTVLPCQNVFSSAIYAVGAW